MPTSIPIGIYLININNHAYFGDRYYIDNAIKAGKEAMKGKHAIIAVEKDRVVMLLSETHKTGKQLGIAKQEYINKGFTVYTA